MFLENFIFLKHTRWQCILSFDNSAAMCRDLKTVHPGSYVLEEDTMTTLPRRQGNIGFALLRV
jgi:hypothetical protein